MANSCVWFDIPATDLDRAHSFYSAVLNMKIDRIPGTDILVLDHSGSDVGGCIVKNSSDQPSSNGILVYMNVQGRLDDAVSKVVPNGGSILQAKHAIGPYGFRATVLDSEGNRIALHSM